jgi:hypothetical protein
MRLQPLIILLLAGSTSAAADQERGRIIPDDWTAESRASAGAPLRYTSPDRTAWAMMYTTPADGGSKRVLSAAMPSKGERVTYRRVTPRFVAIAGLKGKRIF